MKTLSFRIAIACIAWLSMISTSQGQWTTSYIDWTPNRSMHRIFFPSLDTGYVIGSGSGAPNNPTASLYRTTDGGQNWSLTFVTTVGTDTVIQNTAMHFLDNNTGFMAVRCYSDSAIYQTDYAAILKTIDGGNTWTVAYTYKPQVIYTVANPTIIDIYFPDVLNGYAVFTNGKVLATADGGITWTFYNTLATTPLTSIYFTAATTGYTTGGLSQYSNPANAQGSIQKTTNGGSTWTSVYSDADWTVEDVRFSSANIGYAICDSLDASMSYGYAKILKSTDGGNTWSPVSYVNGILPRQVFFLNDTVGYFCGFSSSPSLSVVYRTMDGGVTWYPMWYPDINITMPGGHPQDIFFVDENTGYFINNNGTGGARNIYKTLISDNVWPGDANSDLVANNVDLLNIGLAYNSTGPVRVNASTTWTAQPADDWPVFLPTNNTKHADCNGDGTINDADTLAIAQNYGNTHTLRMAGSPSPSSASPSIYLVASVDSTGLQDYITFDIRVDSAGTGFNLYGLAFTLSFDTTYVEPNSASVDYSGSWLGTIGSSMITLTKSFASQGMIDLAEVRTTSTNMFGSGSIGTLGIISADNLSGISVLHVGISNVTAVTVDGRVLAFTVQGDSVVLDPMILSVEPRPATSFELYPNPASKQVFLKGLSAGDAIHICDIYGRILLSSTAEGNLSGINTSSLTPGAYIIRVRSSTMSAQKILVIH
jgi:photosystem II stability/assembly factor-like uncharacterized protein